MACRVLTAMSTVAKSGSAAEAVVLACRVGEQFSGTVTDIDKKRGAQIQLADPAVITRVPVNGLAIGEAVSLRLDEADPARRLTRFALA